MNRPGPYLAGKSTRNVIQLALQPPERPDNVEHWFRVRDHVREVSRQCGRSEPPRVVAVTKSFPVEICRKMLREGPFNHLGENRVQEALAKRDDLDHPDVHWHMVGHLQSNKVRKIPGVFHRIHSVDRDSVIDEFEKRLEDGDTQEVFLQVNVSGEEAKHGASPSEVDRLFDRLQSANHLEPVGLMTIAPWTDDEEVLRETFRHCRELRERLRDRTEELSELSMGMTNDYVQAIQQGSTVLRLGRILFGERPDG